VQTENDKKEYIKFSKKVDYLHKEYKPRNRNIRAPDGTILMEEDQIIERQREYFQGEQQNVAPTEHYESESRDALDKLVEEPSYEEISIIIMNFRKTKVPGM
jgi:hypothetical protein